MTRSQIVQLILAAAFGVVFLSLILAVSIFIPDPSVFQYQVFRITLALAASGIAAVIPGVLDVKIPSIATASGALSVFAVVYFYSPAQIAVKQVVQGPTPTPSPTPSLLYEHVTNAKVDTLALMEKATDSYYSHTKDIAAVNLELDKAYEYDKERPLNDYIIKSWNVFRDPNGILARFLMHWKKQGTLSPTFIAVEKEHVAREFDDIIQLESGYTPLEQP